MPVRRATFEDDPIPLRILVAAQMKPDNGERNESDDEMQQVDAGDDEVVHEKRTGRERVSRANFAPVLDDFQNGEDDAEGYRSRDQPPSRPGFPAVRGADG